MVIAQALVQLAVAHVHTNDLGGTVLQQAVGEAAGALPHIEAAQAFDHQPRRLEGAFELEPATRDVFRLGIVEQAHLCHGWNVIAVLDHLVPGGQRRQPPLHPRGDQALRL